MFTGYSGHNKSISIGHNSVQSPTVLKDLVVSPRQKMHEPDEFYSECKDANIVIHEEW